MSSGLIATRLVFPNLNPITQLVDESIPSILGVSPANVSYARRPHYWLPTVSRNPQGSSSLVAINMNRKLGRQPTRFCSTPFLHRSMLGLDFLFSIAHFGMGHFFFSCKKIVQKLMEEFNTLLFPRIPRGTENTGVSRMWGPPSYGSACSPVLLAQMLLGLHRERGLNRGNVSQPLPRLFDSVVQPWPERVRFMLFFLCLMCAQNAVCWTVLF